MECPWQKTPQVRVKVLSKNANRVKEYAALLLKEFKWIKFLAIALPVKIFGHAFVAIVDTGSAGVVISKSCFDHLGLAGDDEVEFTITSATDTNKKVRKVLFSLKIAIGKNTEKIMAIVLEGFHFDMLLEVSWLKELKARILMEKGQSK